MNKTDIIEAVKLLNLKELSKGFLEMICLKLNLPKEGERQELIQRIEAELKKANLQQGFNNENNNS